jgi:hypothetical protein
MKLTDGQHEAIRLAIEWYFRRTEIQQVFVLSGYAGTG